MHNTRPPNNVEFILVLACVRAHCWYVQVLYQVTVRTLPSNALYEATVRYDLHAATYDVSSDHVSRINRYASQPHCIAAQLPHLRAYCYCIKQLNR